MFIINHKPLEEVSRELALTYRKIKKSLGFLPPHFELFGTIDPKALSEFIEYNLYFSKHKKIDESLLPFLRLYIAQKENRVYCKEFNTKILQAKGLKLQFLQNIEQNIYKIELDNKQIVLLNKVLYAIYNAREFGKSDLNELYNLGFSDKDFFDLLNYATNFLAKSKMIEIYLVNKL